MNGLAVDKSLQIIFTTHSLEILKYKDLIDIRHIHNTDEKTLCLPGNEFDLIHRMSVLLRLKLYLLKVNYIPKGLSH